MSKSILVEYDEMKEYILLFVKKFGVMLRLEYLSISNQLSTCN